MYEVSSWSMKEFQRRNKRRSRSLFCFLLRVELRIRFLYAVLRIWRGNRKYTQCMKFLALFHFRRNLRESRNTNKNIRSLSWWEHGENVRMLDEIKNCKNSLHCTFGVRVLVSRKLRKNSRVSYAANITFGYALRVLFSDVRWDKHLTFDENHYTKRLCIISSIRSSFAFLWKMRKLCWKVKATNQFNRVFVPVVLFSSLDVSFPPRQRARFAPVSILPKVSTFSKSDTETRRKCQIIP